MIIIPAKITGEIKEGLSRELTPEELATVTSKASIGDDWVFYQGDEPPTAPVDPQPDWLGLEQGLFYSGLRAKAKADPNLDHFEYASLIGAFGNGKLGHTSEGTLQYLLTAINVTWSESDIVTLNQLLENNNFKIRIS